MLFADTKQHNQKLGVEESNFSPRESRGRPITELRKIAFIPVTNRYNGGQNTAQLQFTQKQRWKTRITPYILIFFLLLPLFCCSNCWLVLI